MKVITDLHLGRALTLKHLSKTPHTGPPLFWQRRTAALPGGWVVVSGAVLWSLLGLCCGGAARALSAESTPIQQFAKTLEGEPTQPASHLFHRHPLGFDAQTVQTVLLPVTVPRHVAATALAVVDEEQQKLGSTGMVLLSVFAGLTLTLVLVRRRVDARISSSTMRLGPQVLASYRSLAVVIVRVAAAVFPGLLLLLLLLLSQAFLEQEGPVFSVLGKLFMLWTGASGVLCLAREFFLGPLAPAPHGQALYRIVRFLIRYVTLGLILLWGGALCHFPPDVLALVRFLLVLTVSGSVFLLSTRKEAVLALFPPLPNRLYQRFVAGFRHTYQPVLFCTFTLGLLWTAGYHQLAEFLVARSWAVITVFLGAVFLHHLSISWIQHRVLPDPFPSEAALAFHQALVATMTSVVTLTALLLALGLMGLLTPTLHLLSVPLLTSGKTELSLLVVLQAGMLVLAFFLTSRVVRTYLDYRVFPALGVDLGVAAAINAFLSYTLGALGLLLGLRLMGLDLQALTIFAGALGIGAGFGLQTLTSNLAAGLTLVFGRTLRRGDVVTVGDSIGTVQEVGMRVTRLRTPDNIEILVPNAHLVDSTLTNYTHTSPFIRLHVSVGASYGADPHHIREVMVTVARSCPHVEPQPEPEVWFTEFGENALNFELLVWMNIRHTTPGQVKSALYFALFQAFKAAGIEIPFPQRDLHIRSSVPWPPMQNPENTIDDMNTPLLSGKNTQG